MIELLFVACLRLSPEVCHEERMLVFDNLGPMACMLQTQPRLARWVEEHPAHVVARFRCRLAVPSEKEA